MAEQTKGTQVTVNTVLPGPTRSEGIVDFLKKVSPDAKDATEAVVRTLSEYGIDAGLELSELTPALAQAAEIRDRYSHA